MQGSETADRVVRSVHGWIEAKPDPELKAVLAQHLNALDSYGEPLEFRARFATSDVSFDALIRAAIWRTACESIGRGVRIGACMGLGIGTGAMILPEAPDGRARIVSAGAVGKKDVQPFSVVERVSAKIMRFRDKKEVEASSKSST